MARFVDCKSHISDTFDVSFKERLRISWHGENARRRIWHEWISQRALGNMKVSLGLIMRGREDFVVRMLPRNCRWPLYRCTGDKQNRGEHDE